MTESKDIIDPIQIVCGKGQILKGFPLERVKCEDITGVYVFDNQGNGLRIVLDSSWKQKIKGGYLVCIITDDKNGEVAILKGTFLSRLFVIFSLVLLIISLYRFVRYIESFWLWNIFNIALLSFFFLAYAIFFNQVRHESKMLIDRIYD